MRRALSLTIVSAVIGAALLAGCKGKESKKDEACYACDWKEGCSEACADACGEGCAGCGCGEAACGCGEDEPEPTAAESMERAIEGASVDKEKVVKLKQSFREFARQARASGQLEEAREAWRKILTLDPQDTEARDEFMKLSRELGERVPVLAEVLDQSHELESARREQTEVEIRRLVARARESESDGDFEAAINLYQRTLSILEWYPYQADFSVTSEAVRNLIEQALARKKEADRRRSAKIQDQLLRTEEGRRTEAVEEEMRQMQVWLRLADEAYDRGEYALAQANSEKVLMLDPQNQKAQALIRIAKETKYVADRVEIRQRFNDQWRTTMEQLEIAAIPHPDLIHFPKDWATISRRTPMILGGGDEAATDPRNQQILNTLRQQRLRDINWEAGEITFENAISYIRSVTGENFVLSQKVREEKAEVEVELQVDNVSVTQVLNFITEPHEMAWKVEKGVVMILDKEEAQASPVLRFYDVKDLVAKIQDFPGQEINLVPSRYQPPEEEELDEPVPAFEVDQLIEVIQTTVEPESWDNIEGASIEPKSNILVIRTIPEVHRKIAQLLDDLRKNTGILVALEVRFITAEDAFLRDIGVDIRGLGDQTGGVGLPGKGAVTTFDDNFVGSVADPQGTGQGAVKPEPSSIGTSSNPGVFYSDGGDGEYKGRVENLFDFILGFDIPGQATANAAQGGTQGANSGGLSLQATFIDDTQLEVILRAVEKSQRAQRIAAPNLTVYDTQRANVSVMTQNSYVQDFDVEIAQAAAIGDPIIQTIRDGIILDVRPIVSADRRFITMELRPTVAELVRPIPTFQTSLATGPPVTIQVPELSISRVRTTVTMPDGGTLLLGGIKFFSDETAESGIPILSKIPIISFLVTRKAKKIQRRNLLILVKAEVVILEERAPGFGIR